MSQPECKHPIETMVYKIRDHQNWADMTRAAYSCEKCLPKMRRWVSAVTGHAVVEPLASRATSRVPSSR